MSHRIFNNLLEAYDTSFGNIRDPGNGNRLELPGSHMVCRLRSAAAETRTIVPAATAPLGTEILLVLEVDGGDVTISFDEDLDDLGHTSLVLDDVGDWALVKRLFEHNTSDTPAWRYVTGSVLQTGGSSTLPLTTKGDVLVHDGTNNVRVPVGANGLLLRANSADAEGLEWHSGLSVIADPGNAGTVTPVGSRSESRLASGVGPTAESRIFDAAASHDFGTELLLAMTTDGGADIRVRSDATLASAYEITDAGHKEIVFNTVGQWAVVRRLFQPDTSTAGWRVAYSDGVTLI